ncbi:unnamed protein product [Debaryomyces fabryi]|nr:unnamed protein product [Debaryomyces fabryi]
MSSLNLNLFPSLSPTKATDNNLEDTLARHSDVIVSTNITLYAEYKGFFIYVISATFLTIWVCWTLIPDPVLRSMSIYYYPDKYWALAIPAYTLMLMVYVYVALALYNTEVLTLPLDDVRNFVDEHSVLVGSSEADEIAKANKAIEYLWKSPSGVWDLPVTLVNEVLYGEEEEVEVSL